MALNKTVELDFLAEKDLVAGLSRMFKSVTGKDLTREEAGRVANAMLQEGLSLAQIPDGDGRDYNPSFVSPKNTHAKIKV